MPDVYWGDELESLNLVDPDNRRPVDRALRRRLLDEVREGAPHRAEAAKLAVIARTLELRAAWPDVFSGSYEPVDAGPEICRFRRGDRVEVVVPVKPSAVAGEPAPGWRDLLPELPVGLYVKS